MKQSGEFADYLTEVLGDDESSPRERICAAALECFRRQGVRRATMEDIARAANISRPTIYYYFKDKPSLIVEVVLRQQASSHRIQREKLAGRSGLDAVLEAALLGIDRANRDPYSAELARAESERFTALALQSPAAHEVQAAFWKPLLADARRRGELRDDLTDEQIIHWIVFLQFNIVSNGSVFGLGSNERIREALSRFLLPALQSMRSNSRRKASLGK